MKDSEWFQAIDFDTLMDDGIIFIWTTNAKGTLVSNMMASIGWTEREVVTWSKYDQNGEPLFRGGHDMKHVNERVYLFRRAKPINASDRFQIPRAAPNGIHSIVQDTKISEKPI